MAYDPLPPLGQDDMAGSLPVAIASDQSAVPVSAAALPLPSGAATEAKQDDIITEEAAIKTAVQIMDDWDESDRAKVNPIVGQAGIAAGAGNVGATVPRVTLANDDPAVALLGTIDADTGAIKTATELIDDAIVADDSAFTPATTKVMMAGFEFDDTTPDSVNEGDAGAARMSSRREIYTQIRDAAGNERGANVDASNRLQVVTTAAGNETTTKEVVGDVAQDSPVGGNPVLAGLRASTATPSAMSGDGDAVYAWGTRTGATVVAGDKVDDAAFTPGTDRVVPNGLFADETSTDSVDEGDIGIPRMTLDRKAIVVPEAHTNGGATPYKLISAASTNATSLKASAGQIYSIAAYNINAAVRYLKLYNKALSPTVGTDTPVAVYAIPGNTAGAGFTISFPVGMQFDTGIAFALTTGIADSDTGAVAANEQVVNITYK